MRRTLMLEAAMVLVLGACGGDDAGDTSTEDATQGNNTGEASAGGVIVDPQPPGQAMVMVDG